MEKTNLNPPQIQKILDILDPKVKQLLEVNEVHNLYPTQFTNYTKLNSTLDIPEFKLYKKIFTRQYSELNSLTTKENSSKKKKKATKKKKKSKKSDKVEDEEPEPSSLEPSEQFLNNLQEIFTVNKFGVKKRIKLAVPFNNKTKISFWNLIKDLVGKDLTKISIPVYLNEPASMLQRMMEAFEYIKLLKDAVKEPCQYKRLVLICSYMFIQYSCTQNRNKKPFNPLLGETFEYEYGDFRIFSEQVSHHPPVSAFHIENQEMIVWGHIQLKSKFSVTGLDVSTSGIIPSLFGLTSRSLFLLFEAKEREVRGLQGKDFLVRDK
jgi:hypothetical protein